jgi:hypothetical protein
MMSVDNFTPYLLNSILLFVVRKFMETIEETTVGFLGDYRVAMASMVFDGKYTMPDGSPAQGLICVLVACRAGR